MSTNARPDPKTALLADLLALAERGERQAAAMAKKPSRANPTTVSTACDCGGVYVAAKRFERLATVAVTICWSCGSETPPLYPRGLEDRQGNCSPFRVVATRPCAECQAPIRVQRQNADQAYCSPLCVGRARRRIQQEAS